MSETWLSLDPKWVGGGAGVVMMVGGESVELFWIA